MLLVHDSNKEYHYCMSVCMFFLFFLFLLFISISKLCLNISFYFQLVRFSFTICIHQMLLRIRDLCYPSKHFECICVCSLSLFFKYKFTCYFYGMSRLLSKFRHTKVLFKANSLFLFLFNVPIVVVVVDARWKRFGSKQLCVNRTKFQFLMKPTARSVVNWIKHIFWFFDSREVGYADGEAGRRFSYEFHFNPNDSEIIQQKMENERIRESSMGGWVDEWMVGRSATVRRIETEYELNVRQSATIRKSSEIMTSIIYICWHSDVTKLPSSFYWLLNT